MALDQHVISRVFLVGLFRNTVNKDVDFFFREKKKIVTYSQQISSLSACLIHSQYN